MKDSKSLEHMEKRIKTLEKEIEHIKELMRDTKLLGL